MAHHVDRLSFDAAPVARWPSVSLCMIVKNEAHNLADCLTSVGDLPQEIRIVDTGSTDQTVEIARRFGATVSHFCWVDDFAAARNESLKQAQGDWIFWMDADDRLAPLELARIKTALASNQADGYFCRVVSRGENSVLAADHLRLFRNQRGVVFERPLHEEPTSSALRQGLRLTQTNITIEHTGYNTSPQETRQKQLRNQKILQAHRHQLEQDLYWRFHLAVNAYMLEEYHDAAGHFEAVLANPPASLQQEPGRLYEAHALLIDIYMKLGRPAKAASLLERTLKTFPQRRHAWILAGKFYLSRQAPAQAVEMLECARALPAKNAAEEGLAWPAGTLEKYLGRAYLQWGQQWYKQQNFVAMAEAAVRAVDVAPPGEQVQGYKFLAVALQKLGREQEAHTYWQLALESEVGG